MKKIFFVTGSRAEFDLVKNLLLLLDKSKIIDLHLIVTSTHLSKKFGNSVNYIRSFKFTNIHLVKTHIDKNFNIHNLDSISNGITKITKIFEKKKPDLVCVSGDRYEMLSSAISAYFLNIPIAHFFGGDVTTGSLDDGTRHVLTKFSNFHFVNHPINYNRIVQLGEEKRNIFLTNHIGFDSLLNSKLISKELLLSKLGITFKKNVSLIVFHPENSSPDSIKNQAKLICSALADLKNYTLIFNKPNSDNYSNIIDKVFLDYVKNNNNAFYIDNLGHQKYLSLLNCVNFIIGNSSSGLSEMPFFSKPTINLGKRQMGRHIDYSVINSSFDKLSIIKAIKKSNNKIFLKNIKTKNTYYNYKTGGSKKTFKILVNIISKINILNPINKKFID